MKTGNACTASGLRPKRSWLDVGGWDVSSLGMGVGVWVLGAGLSFNNYRCHCGENEPPSRPVWVGVFGWGWAGGGSLVKDIDGSWKRPSSQCLLKGTDWMERTCMAQGAFN